eukprot:m51a1_g4188 hypothetical protein (419) ;mRNA; r:385795-389065
MDCGKSVLGCPAIRGEYEVRIENFATLPRGPVKIPEEGFVLAGHRWHILFYSRGGSIGDQDYISVFLQLLGPLAPVEESHELPSAKWTCTIKTTAGEPVLSKTLQMSQFTAEPPTDAWGWRRAFKRDEIIANCPDDSFVLHAKVKVAVMQVHTIQSVPLGDASAEAAVARCLGSLLQSGVGADVTFVVGDSCRRFPAHRAVVAARSPVLCVALFGSVDSNRGSSNPAVFVEGQTGEIRVEGADEGSFEVFLEFLYKGTSVSDSPEAPLDLYMHLLELADRYDVKDLASVCEDRLYKRLCSDRAAEILSLAERCNARRLRESCVQWVVTQPHLLSNRDFWKSIGPDCCAEIARTLMQGDVAPNNMSAHDGQDNAGQPAAKKRRVLFKIATGPVTIGNIYSLGEGSVPIAAPAEYGAYGR